MTTTDAVLNPQQAQRLETEARRHWRTGRRATLLFAAELCQLRDGGAHRLRGFENFGTYAQHKFADLPRSSARHYAWMGATLLTLQAHRRLSLSDWPLPVGNTGVRALAAAAGKHGDELMLTVFDRACRENPGAGPVSDRHVTAALAALAPRPESAPPSPQPRDPYEPDEEQVLDIDAVPDALRELAQEMDELLRADWEGEMDADRRQDVMHELQALQARLERFRQRIS